MYIIINNTRNSTTTFFGSYPSEVVTELIVNNNQFIIIDLYSNTIKVPTVVKEGEDEEFNINWTEYPLPLKYLSQQFIANL